MEEDRIKSVGSWRSIVVCEDPGCNRNIIKNRFMKSLIQRTLIKSPKEIKKKYEIPELVNN